MSRTIDERVVEMRFDNQHFERNVSNTMSTLDKLKQKLNLTGASKGLENVNAAAGKVNMTGLGAAVEAVSVKFSALQVMGVTALANITNSAVNAGKRIVSALTIDPVKTGFQEYETQINAVQTILANTQSKGSTLDDVNKALDDLNKYADMTIYNFTEMTRNIGTFTAAGVDLDTSVNAIKGIANLAAISGSTSQQASTAMYQLSQALASGTVKLMDWNSVVNAGMGGQVFQDALKETARVHGVAIDAMIEENGSFRESLQEGWLTSEILTDTLNKFTLYAEEGTKEWDEYKASLKEQGYTEEQAVEILKLGKSATEAATKVKTFTQLWDVLKEAAQSGWTQSWEIIVGDFEEAKSLLTPLSDVLTGLINKFSNWRNNILELALGNNPFSKIMDRISELIKPAQKAADAVNKTISTIENLDEIALKVIRGDYKNTDTGRRQNLMAEGYNWAIVQNRVNEMLNNTKRHSVEAAEAELELYKAEHGLVDKGGELSETQEDVNSARADSIDQLMKMTDAQLEELGLTKEEIKAFRELAEVCDLAGIKLSDVLADPSILNGRNLLINGFKNIGEGLKEFATIVKNAWQEIFPPKTIEERAAQLHKLIAIFHGFTQPFKTLIDENGKLSETGDKLLRTFKGVFAVIGMVTDILGGGLKIAFKAVNAILKYFNIDILDVTAGIGDALVKFREMTDVSKLFSKAIEFIAPILKKSVTTIKSWFDSFKSIPQVQKAITKIKEAFSNLKDLDFKEIGKNIVDGLKNGLGDGIKEVVAKIIEIGKKILEGIKEILGIHSPSTEFFEIGKNIIEGLVNGLKAAASTVWETVKNVGQKCIEIFNGIDWGALFAVGISVGMIYFIKKISDAFDTLSGPIDAVTDILENCADVVENFAKLEKALAFNVRMEGIKSLAIAIAILAGSVIALTLIDQHKMVNAVFIIGILSGILIGLAVAMEKISNSALSIGKDGVKMEGFKSALLLIAGALLILAIVVKIIGTMEIEQAIQGFVGLGTLVAAISLVFLAFGKFVTGKTAKNIDKAGSMIFKMSLALLMLVGIAKLIAGMSWDDMGKAAVGIGGLVGVIALLVTISMIPGKKVGQIGSTLLKISGAMLIMVGVAKLIAGMSWADMGKATIGIAGLVMVIATLMVITMIPGQNVDKIGSTLLKISGAMIILAFTARLISGMEWEDMGKAVVGLLGLSAVIGVLIGVVRLAGKDAPKIAGTLLAMSVAIGILAAVAVMLSLISIDGLAKGIIAVSMLSTFMALMIYATRGASDCKGNLIVMAVAIGVMAAAVAALSLIDGSKLAGATIALDSVMGMFALMTKMANGMKSSIGGLIAIIAAVGLLGGLLYLLSTLPTESVLGAGAALSMILLSLSASMMVLNTMSTVSPMALVAVGAMTIVVGALAGILYLLKDLPMRSTLAVATSLSMLLLSLSAACAILSVVGMTGYGAFVGIAALLVLIAGVGALIVGIGALVDKFPEVETFLDKGIPILEKIGYGLGSFFGNIVSGFMTSATSALPEIAKSLSGFMTNLQPFIDGAKNIDVSVLAGIGALSAAIIMLSAAEFITAVTSFLSGGMSFAELGADLSAFMMAATPFFTGIRFVNPAALEGVRALAGAILILTATDVIDGMTSWLTGGNSLGEFGSQLGQLGTDLNTFATNLGDFNESKVAAVTCAAKAIKTLAQAASEIPNDGGLAGFFAGENCISNFGEKLPQLGLDLASFATNLGTFTDAQVSTVAYASEAIKNMASAASEIPNDGGLAGFFAGENCISKFGEKLPQLGLDLVAFVTNLGTFTDAQVSTVTCAANAIKNMADAASEIDGQSDWGKKLFGDNSITTFGSQLASLGTNLAAFVANLGTFDEGKVTSVNYAVKALNALTELANADLKGAKKHLPTFSTELANLASSIKSFCENLPSDSAITTAGSNIQLMLDIIDNIATRDANVISTFATSLNTIGTNGVKAFVKAFTDDSAKTKISGAGKKMMDKLVDGAESKKDSTKDAFKKLAEAGADAAGSKTLISEFKSAGKDLGDGLVKGIEAKEQAVYDAAYALGQMAVQGEKDGQASNSPSKLTILAGKWLGEGLIIGMQKMTNAVYGEGKDLGQNATDPISSAIARIGEAFDSDMDVQPTITPVLDLSNISAGAGAISGMLDMNPSVGLMSNVRSISSMMNSGQNGVNDDVISAIYDLKKSIGALSPGDTVNINGITYDDGSNINTAIRDIVRVARMERRV